MKLANLYRSLSLACRSPRGEVGVENQVRLRANASDPDDDPLRTAGARHGDVSSGLRRRRWHDGGLCKTACFAPYQAPRSDASGIGAGAVRASRYRPFREHEVPGEKCYPAVQLVKPRDRASFDCATPRCPLGTQQAQQFSDALLSCYNEGRPHDSLGPVPPLTHCRAPQPG